MGTSEDDRELRAALEQAQHQVKLLTRELQRLRALQPDALLEQVARLQNQVAQLEQQHDVADQVRATWLAERAALRQELERLTALCDAQQQQLERADEVRAEWHRQLSSLQAELDAVTAEAPVTITQHLDAVRRITLLERELEEARRALARAATLSPRPSPPDPPGA